MANENEKVGRTELVARLADAYLEEHAAQIQFRSAALYERPGATRTVYLAEAADSLKAADAKVQRVCEGVGNEILYRDLVIGEALQVAESVRDARTRKYAEQVLSEARP